MRLHEPFSDALLSDYTDHALPLFTSLRVSLHLRHCPECQKTLEQIQRLGTAAQAWHGNARSPWPSVPPHKSGIFWRSAPYGAVAVVAASTLFLVLRPHVSPQEGLTFGDLVYAMEKVHTARWVGTITLYEKIPVWDRQPDGKQEVKYSHTMEHFARLEPPALAERPLPGSGNRSSVNLTSEQGEVSYSPATKQWRVASPSIKRELRTKALSEQIRYAIFTPDNKEFAASEGVSSIWQTRHITVDGKDLLELRRESSGKRHKTMQRILADPVEKRAVRSESRQFDARDNRLEVEIINDQFRYNEPSPSGLFELKPPKGAKVIRLDHHSSGIWPSLSARDRAEISRVISASDSAWQVGDFTSLARVWDFDYLSRLPHATATGAERKKNWQRLTVSQRGRWQTWQSSVQAAYRQRGVVWADSYLPPSEPDILAVTVQARIGWQEPRKGTCKQTDETSKFYLRQLPSGGWRIVYWKYPEDDVIFRVHARQIKTLPTVP